MAQSQPAEIARDTTVSRWIGVNPRGNLHPGHGAVAQTCSTCSKTDWRMGARMEGDYGKTNAALEGMRWKTASSRAWQFVRPACVATLVLSLFSLMFKGTAQGVLVGAFADLLSLTTIKLFSYVLLVVYGTSIMLDKVRLASRATWWVGGRIASVTFDCTSTTLGVLVGMAPALAFDRGLKYAAAWAALFSLMLAFLLALLWLVANFKHLSVHWDFPKIDKRVIMACGLLLVLVGIWSIARDGWREAALQPACTNASASVPLSGPGTSTTASR